MSKKLLALLLATLMLVGLFTGCAQTGTEPPADTTTAPTSGNDDTTAGNDSEELEPVTLRIFNYQCAASDDANVVEYINNLPSVKALNVTVEFVNFGSMNERTEKLPLLMATSEQMDLVFDASWLNYYNYMRNGVYADISGFLAEDPEMYNLIPEGMWEGQTYEGGIYGIPCYKETATSYVFVATQEMLDKAGLTQDDITEFKDVEPLLAAMQEDGHSLMWASAYEGVAPLALMKDYAFVSGNANYGVVKRDGSSSEVMNPYATEEFKEAIQCMYDWKQKGYIVDDFITNGNGNLYNDAGYKNGLSYTNWTPKVVYDKNTEYADGSLVPLFVTGAPITDNSVTAGSVFCILDKCQNKERAYQFLRLCYFDADLCNALAYGVEGVEYNLTEDGLVEPVADKWNMWQGQNWLMGNMWLMTPTVTDMPNKVEVFQEWNASAEVLPTNGFILDTKPIQNQISTVNAVLAEYLKPLALGYVDPETGIAEMNAQLEAAGFNELIAEVQAQYDAWLASK